MLPSIRVMVRLPKKTPNSHSKMPAVISTSRSICVMPCSERGVTVAEQPSTKKMLKRLLPTTLPMAISGFFFRAATMLVANSGSEVPPATMVKPMTASLTPSPRAMPLAPLTNPLPPSTKAARPPTIKRVDFQRGMGRICTSSSPLGSSSFPAGLCAMAKV